jgi:hypothetical protein
MAGTAGLSGRLRAGIEAHLGSRDVARVIYGAIIGLALVLAIEPHPPSAAEAAAVLVGTAIAVGLAELYSDIVGTEARTRQAVGAAQARSLAGEALAVVFGAAFPAVFFVLAAWDLMEVGTAFTLSKWSGFGLICLYGFLAARLSGAGIARSLAHSAALGLIGGALIALKALLH